MPDVYQYPRITAQQLSDALHHLDLPAIQFARLIGAQRKRVLGWLAGEDRIPHHVHLLARLLVESDEAYKTAETLADECVIGDGSPDGR